MTILNNEYVETIVQDEIRQMTTARIEHARSAAQDRDARGLTVFSLMILNVLLTAAVGINIGSANIFAYVMAAGLAISSVYTARQIDEMFGTKNSNQE